MFLDDARGHATALALGGCSLAEQKQQQGLLNVEPIFGLIEDDGLGTIEDFGGDLFAAMGGEAMHEDGAVVGLGEQF